MTISIASLNQNTPSEQPPSDKNKKNIKKTRSHGISRLIASRRRRGVKNTDDEAEDGEDDPPPRTREGGPPARTNGHLQAESSSSDDDSSISSLGNSDEDHEDDQEDPDDHDDEEEDEENEDSKSNLNQVKKQMMAQRNAAASDDDLDTQFEVDPNDLEAGVRKPAMSDPNPSEYLQNHSDLKPNNSLAHDETTTNAAQIQTSSTFVPNKIAKNQLGQTPADEPPSPSHTGHPNALSPPTSSANLHNARRQQNSVAVSSQPLNTAIIFNQASWVTGLSAALAATTTSSNNNNSSSTDDQPVQTPRYIPYIEFENYSAYGNLIFDLNSGLGRTARVDCKPDGLEKAPPEDLEEQFVRIQPSLDLSSGSAQQPTPSSTKGSRRKSALPVEDKPDLDQNSQEEQEDHHASRRGKKLVSLSDKKKKKKKKKKKEITTRESSEAPGDETQNEPSDPRFKIKIIPPPPSSSKNRPPTKASSASASSHHNPSSLAGGLNRPSSAFSHASHSEGNRSGSASEAHSLEPWAVPRSGRFWGHDDRQSYSQRRGGRGGFVQNRGGSGSARGTLRKRGGFRGDWPSTPPLSRRPLGSHGSTHRSETPAGQSDASRSVGSGAGWITVPSKQKASGGGFHQNRQSQFNSQKHQSKQADGGEWRHDGWEEIERETGRKHHSNHRGRDGTGPNHQSRGGAGWRGGAPFIPPRRPASNFVSTPSNRTSHAPSANDNPTVGGKTEDRVSNPPTIAPVRRGTEDESKVPSNLTASTDPSGKDGDEVNVPSNPTPSPSPKASQTSARDSSPKLVNGDDSREEKKEVKKTESIPASDAVPQPNQPSSQSDPAFPSTDTNVTSVKLPKTIKIGTIPVYPPGTLQPVVAEKIDSPKSKVPLSPVGQGVSSVPGTDQSPSTPELSDTPQVSGSASTLDDHPSPHPNTALAPVICTESSSGSITLGSAGGAQVLREAMSTPKILPPSHAVHHDSMIPQSRVEHPMGIVNSFDHSRTSSFNSHSFPPVSFRPHPDFVEQQPHLRHPPPLNPPPNHHQPHMASSATYHNPIPAPPPQTTIHTPATLYQPQLPAIPPLQYFDPNNHNLSYPHPSSLGPPPMNHVYGGYMPQPPQMASSRPHPPPLYYPQTTTFEPTPPPLPPLPPLSAPVAGTASNGMILPGHFAPPKSTKVRISNPGSAEGNHSTTDHHQQNFHYHIPNYSNRISTDASTASADPSQIKMTETGINYYEHNGVTYFGDCIPPITSAPNTPMGALMNDSVGNGGEKLSGDRNGMMMNMGIHEGFMGRGEEFRTDDPYRYFNPPNHHHHQYQSSNGPPGHGFDIGGHTSVPNNPISTDRSPYIPNHHHSTGHINHGHCGTGGSGGQVVLSQVIRPPSIPFG